MFSNAHSLWYTVLWVLIMFTIINPFIILNSCIAVEHSLICSLSWWLCFSKIAYKWNHTIYSFLKWPLHLKIYIYYSAMLHTNQYMVYAIVPPFVYLVTCWISFVSIFSQFWIKLLSTCTYRFGMNIDFQLTCVNKYIGVRMLGYIVNV